MFFFWILAKSNSDFEWQRFVTVVNLEVSLIIRMICGLKLGYHVQSRLACHKRRRRCIFRDWFSCDWETQKKLGNRSAALSSGQVFFEKQGIRSITFQHLSYETAAFLGFDINQSLSQTIGKEYVLSFLASKVFRNFFCL